MLTMNNKEIQERIIPIFHYCQAHKGDLSIFNEWHKREDAVTKLFFAYYSELFFRMLFLLEYYSCSKDFYEDCETLLDKYNWYDIQNYDLQLFIPQTKSVDYCEVPGDLEVINGFDDVIWKNTRFSNGRSGNGRAICFAKDGGLWTFADVRGCIYKKLGVIF